MKRLSLKLSNGAWLICNLKFLFSSLLPSSKLKSMSLEFLLLKVRFLGLPQCINKLWYVFSFFLLAHAGVWLLSSDILALWFASSFSQKNTNLIKFGSKKCISSIFYKMSKYCCLLFMKDFLNHLSHFSEDVKVIYNCK